MIDTDKYEGHTEGPWDVYGPHPLFRSGAFDDEGVGEDLPFTRVDMKLIADAPLLLAEVKRLREELFNTHAFYSNMEQMLAFAVGIKQGLLPDMSMDDLVDAVNRDFHDRLNEHMDGRLRE